MAESNVTFLVLVNPKSGGQDGPHLLEKFRDLFKEVRTVYMVFGVYSSENVKGVRSFGEG